MFFADDRVFGWVCLPKSCYWLQRFFNAAGLQRVLKQYVEYYARSRTHLAHLTCPPSNEDCNTRETRHILSAM